MFVLLFTASDADLNSAVAFCLSWNSFVDATGIFLNLVLYSAQSVFIVLCHVRETMPTIFRRYQVSFSKILFCFIP